MTVSPMQPDRFWVLIARTTDADEYAQIEALETVLSELAAEDIAAFQQTFDEAMARSYSWDLWGAAYVIHGCASDDGFEYFRCWLISTGRELFEGALKDADSLADMVPGERDEPLELQEIAYVASRVWEDKIGRDWLDEASGFPRRPSYEDRSVSPSRKTRSILRSAFPDFGKGSANNLSGRRAQHR